MADQDPVSKRQQITSLEPLRDAPLVNLSFAFNDVTDLSPLDNNTNLRRLDCIYNRIASLEPLKNLRLREILAHDNPIRDLSPLRGQPLTRLSISETDVTSLEPIRGIKLRGLGISLTRITDLSPLAGMPIEDLSANFAPVSDLTPLRNMPITNLSIICTLVRDLAPLAGMPLTRLECLGCPVSDLAPLRGSRLQLFNCSRTQVTSLAPLEGMALHGFECWDTPITSLAPFENEPPALFNFDSATLSDVYLEPVLNRWEKHGDRAGLVRQERIERALRAGNRDALRNLAAQYDGHHYLISSRRFTFEEAMALAQSVGGHLVTIHDADENEFVRNLLVSSGEVAHMGMKLAWLGMKPGEGGPVWVTGEPVIFEDFNSGRARHPTKPQFMIGLPRGFRHWYSASAPGPMECAIIEWDD